MKATLLRKIWPDHQWSGPCVVILGANAAIQPVGADAVQGGAKIYSPRAISGRIGADAACLSSEGSAVLIIQQQKVRMATGGDVVKQALTVVDADQVLAVEMPDTALLSAFGVAPPVLRNPGSGHGSDPGTQIRPK